MARNSRNLTCGQATMALLEAYGADTVFGIPGVDTRELYRGLAATGLRHVQPRHEQGAGFMADGYARVSGRPAVCLLITGPGLTNAATAIGQAYSDSVPMIVVTTVQATADLGAGRNKLHEITRQSDAIAPLTAFSTTALAPGHVAEAIARAYTRFATTRPRPVHLELPLDVLVAPATFAAEPRTIARPPAPDAAEVDRAARLLAKAKRPVMIMGGGAADCGPTARALAERVGAAIIPTIAGKGAVREDHPLCLGAVLPVRPAREFLRQADVVVAVGTEMSETDHWTDRLQLDGKLIRIDLDADSLVRDYPPDVAILADAGAALGAIVKALGPSKAGESRGYANRHGLTAARKSIAAGPNVVMTSNAGRKHIALLKALREAVPEDGIVFSDATQIAYTGNTYYPCWRPRTWFHPVGYCTLGFAMPAALGGKLAAPDRPVVALSGDGGFLFTVAELGTAVEQRLPVPIVLWNNDGYGEIRDNMIGQGIPAIGVSPRNPDYVALAKAFGARAVRPTSMTGFQAALRKAFKADGPTLIEVHQDSAFLP
ncbi:MAG: 5-guanidino-2-oxopentanoate decarboxylase [Alphaproteobacteria bacterium]